MRFQVFGTTTNCRIDLQHNLASLRATQIPGYQEIAFNFTQMLVTDIINDRGLEYLSDYSANYTSRSIIDKEYVDSNTVGPVSNIYIIRSEADFPNTPAGGQLAIGTGTYRIQNGFSTSNEWVFDADANVEFIFDSKSNQTITYTGTGTFFQGTPERLGIRFGSITLSGVSATLFNMSSTAFNPSLFIDQTNIVATPANTCSLGLVTGMPSQFIISNIIGFTEGLELSISLAHAFFQCFLQFGDGTTAGNQLKFNGVNDIVIDQCVFFGGGSNLDIRPNFAGLATIMNNRSPGTSTWFEAGTSGTFTQVLDNSFAAEPITAVNDGSPNAIFIWGAGGPPFLYTDQLVTVAGLTNYANGVYRANVLNPNAFELLDVNTNVPLAYNGNDTGNFTTTSIAFDSVGVPPNAGDMVNISQSINYNGGYITRGFDAATFAFAVDGVAFNGTDTGNWTTGSLDQTSIYVSASDNQNLADSQKIGSGVVGQNATATVINTQNVFEDLNLSGSFVAASNIEGFTVTNSTTGEIRYDRIEDFQGSYQGILAAVSSGGSQRFNFQLLKNGVVLPTPDNVEIPIDVGTDITAAPLLWPIELSTNDLVRIQVANADGTSNITIDTLKVDTK